MENKKLAAKISILTTKITLAGMLLLWLVISFSTTSIVRNDITSQMMNAVESRAVIIDDYVTSAEEYLKAFALSGEVQHLLKNPDDPELLRRAQQYTVDFSNIKGIFEGLYIADTNTYVLTHTAKEAIGITTRKGEDAETFRNTILATKDLTNLGIMQSPGTGNMVISIYCPIYDGSTCIGFVGTGVYADRLMDALLDLELKNLPENNYVFMNAHTGIYLYHVDESLLNTQVKEKGHLTIIAQAQKTNDTKPVMYTYRNEKGRKQLAVYKYLPDREWIFMVQADSSKVYSSVIIVGILMGIACAVVAALLLYATRIILSKTGRELMIVENAISELSKFNLTADTGLESFYGRKDEIGMIADATHNVCRHLKAAFEDIERILSEIADGNLTVDVKKNETYYIGDLNMLTGSLQTIRSKLTKVLKEISSVSNQVNTEAEQALSRADAMSHGAAEQTTGEAGKGFAVVADEVRILAGQSAEAARNTTALIREAVAAVETGTQISDLTNQALQEVVASAESVSDAVSSIFQSAGDQSSAIDQISQELERISNVVKSNGDVVRDSAAVSERMSEQAVMLRNQVSKFQL
ncbi:MAG: methyl-accepting chemotaxis protein [Lachnospiraceae bacterium]